MMTFLTGPRRCFLASAPLVKRPVDSTTISAPTLAQSISPGSFTLKTLNDLPSTEIESSVCVTLCGRLPRMESYFSKCARVLASVTSFTATNWISLSSSAVRMMLRPMRPKPLMPTLMGITSSDGIMKLRRALPRETAAKSNLKCYGLRKKKSTRSRKQEFRPKVAFTARGQRQNLLWVLLDVSYAVTVKAHKDGLRRWLAVDPVFDVVSFVVAFANLMVGFADGGYHLFAVHADDGPTFLDGFLHLWGQRINPHYRGGALF